MLQQGSVAPDFVLPDQNNQEHRLSEYRGKWVVLYFYPKDNTPGCTKEACGFRDEHAVLDSLNAVVLGISKDSVQSHEKFIRKFNLPFSLLSDVAGQVIEIYGAWKQKSMYGKTFMGINRSTYLIDPEGKIAKIYPKVKVEKHIVEIIDDLKNLRR
jgi:peroxiredoxin Q/BCP